MAIVTNGGAVPQVLVQVTANPGQIENITSGAVLDVSLTVAGATPEMMFYVDAPSLEDGLGIVRAWCATAGTVKIRIANFTAAPVNPASQNFRVVGF